MRSSFVAAVAALPLAAAVFYDEVGHIDFHHELLGVPQAETTFFHRPRLEDKASLLYTLSDVGVLGAVNPSSGAVVWRQFLSGNITSGGGHLRAGEGESWVASALGSSVHAWNAVNGRNVWWMDFAGHVKDLEIMEMTEDARKDVLALYQEEGATALRRIHGNEGSVVWEFREASKDVPLQVSTNVEKVFVVSLHGSPASYTLRVVVLDTLTGKKLDELIIGTKGDVHSAVDVMFVGANSAAPILAWTDDSFSKLKINVLGTKQKQEFALGEGTMSIEIHAPHLVQSHPHFLVHSRTRTGNRADVYHVDLKTNAIKKAYDLPLVSGNGAFSTSSAGANVYFTRITDDEVVLTDSTSHGVLSRWPLKSGNYKSSVVHAVSEVIKKADDSFAVRSAAVTDAHDWALVRNGEQGWVRPEGLTGAVAAAFAEIPESENLARALEQEAHSNPLSAYLHRVNRHIEDLQHLPAYLQAIPQRFMSSLLGTEMSSKVGLSRDSFGFHKIIVIATRRGRVYGLDAGGHGKMLWTKQAFDVAPGEAWDVKGIHVDDVKGRVTIRGAKREYIVIKPDTGVQVEKVLSESGLELESTALVDGPLGPWLLPVGKGGKVDDIPATLLPKQTVVVRGPHGELKGLKFVQKGPLSVGEPTWIFSPPARQRIVSVASRPLHDPVASIGRVLGDRGVKYKYLNPNTLVVASVDDASSTLTVSLLDTISGQLLSSAVHEGVDTAKPVECAMSENWFACSFFGQYALKDNAAQSLRGYQLVVSDLYESHEANDRGPLGDAANFSTLNPIDEPVEPVLPAVVSQTWIVASPLAALAVTQTRQGISSRQLLAYLPEDHGIVALPRHLLEPRRPVGRDPTPGEMEEGLMRYAPNIEIDPKMVITHERDVVGVRSILTSPTHVESTSLVLAYGIDVFGTRVAPSFTFDILGKGFGKVSMIGTVMALMAGVAVLGPMVSLDLLSRHREREANFVSQVRRKQINLRWKAPM